MKSIYLDNAATTPIDPEVFEAMKPYLLEDYGNPSSTHAHGRKTKTAIESARKKIAEILNCTPGEIIFTSGGTEADNTVISSAITRYGLKNVITSPAEHHAVLHTLEHTVKVHDLQLQFVKLDEKGFVNLDHLQSLLEEYPNAFVSLMHANNEIGNLLNITAVGELCKKNGAYFHSDTVQTMSHYRHDLQNIPIDAITAAAHKFHGPKGVGFMFIRKSRKLDPWIHGGPQERSMRGGTENVYGIVGLAKALEIGYRDMDEHRKHITMLKSRMMEQVSERIPGVTFNGASADLDESLYTVLSVSLPESEDSDMLLFNLDLRGISASGGSACSSGAQQGSHVLAALYPGSKRGVVRFSFSKYNTVEEVDAAALALEEITLGKTAQMGAGR